MNKKIIMMMIVSAMMTTGVSAFAQEDVLLISQEDTKLEQAQQENHAQYIKHKMKVVSVGEKVDGIQMLETSGDTESIANIMLSDEGKTLIFDTKGNPVKASDIKEGMEITMFQNGNSPMVLVYPPRYTPDVIIVHGDEDMGSVDVDKYDENLLNSAGNLLVRIGDDTKLENNLGETVEAKDVVNKNLVVFYDISTKSIPAQTNAIKIVVLEEDKEEAIPEENQTASKLLVNGKGVEVDFVTMNGTEMLPVRSVAEALGLEVKWDAELSSVSVGTIPMGVTFKVGEDSYTKARMMPIALNQAPIIVETEENQGLTYVPVSFFNEVLEADVQTEDGVISINMAE